MEEIEQIETVQEETPTQEKIEPEVTPETAPEVVPEIIPEVSTTNEQNVRTLRAQNKENERRLRESYAFIERLQKASNVPTPPTIVEDEIGDDDMVDGRNFFKVKKDLEDVKRQLAYTQQITVNSRLNSEFPDIKQVLSPANIERLETEHPEFSPGIISTSNKYDQFKMMYKLVKNLGIYTNKTHQKISPNAKKPLPVTAISRDESALTHAHGFSLTEEEKAEFRRKNKEAMG